MQVEHLFSYPLYNQLWDHKLITAEGFVTAEARNIKAYKEFLEEDARNRLVEKYLQRKIMMVEVQELLKEDVRSPRQNKDLSLLLKCLGLGFGEDGLLVVKGEEPPPKKRLGAREPNLSIWERQLMEEDRRIKVLKYDLRILDEWLGLIHHRSKVRKREHIPEDDRKAQIRKQRERSATFWNEMDAKRRTKVNNFHADNDNAWKKICKVKTQEKEIKKKSKHVTSFTESYISSDSSTFTPTAKLPSKREKRTDGDVHDFVHSDQILTEATQFYKLHKEVPEEIPERKTVKVKKDLDLLNPRDKKKPVPLFDMHEIPGKSLAALELRKAVIIRKRLELFRRLLNARIGAKDEKPKRTLKRVKKDIKVLKLEKQKDEKGKFSSPKRTVKSEDIAADEKRKDYRLKECFPTDKRKDVERDSMFDRKELFHLDKKRSPEKVSVEQAVESQEKGHEVLDTILMEKEGETRDPKKLLMLDKKLPDKGIGKYDMHVSIHGYKEDVVKQLSKEEQMKILTPTLRDVSYKESEEYIPEKGIGGKEDIEGEISKDRIYEVFEEVSVQKDLKKVCTQLLIKPDELQSVRESLEIRRHTPDRKPENLSLEELLRDCKSDIAYLKISEQIFRDIEDENAKLVTSDTDIGHKDLMRAAKEHHSLVTAKEVLLDKIDESTEKLPTKYDLKKIRARLSISPDEIKTSRQPLESKLREDIEDPEEVSLEEIFKRCAPGIDISESVHQTTEKTVFECTKLSVSDTDIEVKALVKSAKDLVTVTAETIFDDKSEEIIEKRMIRKDDKKEAEIISFIKPDEIQLLSQPSESKLSLMTQISEDVSLEEILRECAPDIEYSNAMEQPFGDVTKFKHTKAADAHILPTVIDSKEKDCEVVAEEVFYDETPGAMDKILLKDDDRRISDITPFINPEEIKALRQPSQTKLHSALQKAKEVSLEEIIKTCFPITDISNVVEQTFKDTTEFQKTRFSSSETDTALVKSAAEQLAAIDAREIFDDGKSEFSDKSTMEDDLKESDIIPFINPDEIQTVRESLETERLSAVHISKEISSKEIAKTHVSKSDLSKLIGQLLEDIYEIEQWKRHSLESGREIRALTRNAEEQFPEVDVKEVSHDREQDALERISVKDDLTTIPFILPDEIETVTDYLESKLHPIVPEPEELSVEEITKRCHSEIKLKQITEQTCTDIDGLKHFQLFGSEAVTDVKIREVNREEELTSVVIENVFDDTSTRDFSAKYYMKKFASASVIEPCDVQTLKESLTSDDVDDYKPEIISINQLAERCASKLDFRSIAKQTFKDIDGVKCKKIGTPVTDFKCATIKSAAEEKQVEVATQKVSQPTLRRTSEKPLREEDQIINGKGIPKYAKDEREMREFEDRNKEDFAGTSLVLENLLKSVEINLLRISSSKEDITDSFDEFKSDTKRTSAEDTTSQIASQAKKSIHIPLLEDESRYHISHLSKAEAPETYQLDVARYKIKPTDKRRSKMEQEILSEGIEEVGSLDRQQQLYGDLKECVDTFYESFAESSSERRSRERKFTLTSSEKSDDSQKLPSDDLKSSETPRVSVTQYFQTIEEKLKHAEKRLSVLALQKRTSIQHDTVKKKNGQRRQTRQLESRPSISKIKSDVQKEIKKAKDVKETKSLAKKPVEDKDISRPSTSKLGAEEEDYKDGKDTLQAKSAKKWPKHFQLHKQKFSDVSTTLLEKVRSAKVNKGLILNTSLFRRLEDTDEEKKE